MDLSCLLKTSLSKGLRKQAVIKPSQWAEKYRVMGRPFPGKWTFDHHPWLREMHDCTDEIIVGQKAAQMGYTEMALNRTFAAIDLTGDSVLYILPTQDDAADFSSSRFDPALDNSEHLKDLFGNVKNVGHKRAGDANLFVRGSKARSKLKSVPAGKVVYDELDEMDQRNVALASERTSGQLDKLHYYISTPTIAHFGINEKYLDSTQDHFFFKAPCCGHRVEWTLDDVVLACEDHTSKKILESYLQCPHCKKKIPHEAKRHILADGEWVKQYSDKLARGFHIPQMYSSTVTPGELAIAVLKSRHNPADEQELHNSKCGQVHTVEGARVTEEMILKAQCNYMMPGHFRSHRPVTMGIDVGKHLHCIIYEWAIKGQARGTDISAFAKPRLIAAHKVDEFEELDILIKDYGVHYSVIDSNPERRKSMEFCQHWEGRAARCIYAANRGPGKSIHIKEDQISVDRTTWLDITLGRFKGDDGIDLPADSPLEYKNHMQALTRIYQKDRDGNLVGRYVTGNVEDHYAHASNYAEMALPLAAEVASGTTEMPGVL